MKYEEVYKTFKDAKYPIQLDPFSSERRDWINYDSDYIWINENQFKNYGSVFLTNTKLIILTNLDFDMLSQVELGYYLEDINSLKVGKRWWANED